MSTSAFVLPLAVSIFFVLGCAILVLMLTVDYSFSATRAFAYSHAAVIAASGQAQLQRYLSNGAARHYTGTFYAHASGRHPNPSYSTDNETRADAFLQALRDFYGSVAPYDPSYEAPYTPSVTYADGSSVSCFNGRRAEANGGGGGGGGGLTAITQQDGSYEFSESDAAVYCRLVDTSDTDKRWAAAGEQPPPAGDFLPAFPTTGGGGIVTPSSKGKGDIGALADPMAAPRTLQRTFVEHDLVDVRSVFSSSPYASGALAVRTRQGTYDAEPGGGDSFPVANCPRGETLSPYFTSVYVHPERLRPTLGVCGPLYYKGSFVGISHSAVHLSVLGDVLADMPRTSSTLLVLLDSEGLVVATSERRRSSFEVIDLGNGGSGFVLPAEKDIPRHCAVSRKGKMVCRYSAADLPNFSLLNRLARERPEMFTVAAAPVTAVGQQQRQMLAAAEAGATRNVTRVSMEMDSPSFDRPVVAESSGNRAAEAVVPQSFPEEQSEDDDVAPPPPPDLHASDLGWNVPVFEGVRLRDSALPASPLHLRTRRGASRHASADPSPTQPLRHGFAPANSIAPAATETSTSPDYALGPEDYAVRTVKIGQDTYYCTSVLIDTDIESPTPSGSSQSDGGGVLGAPGGPPKPALRWRFIVAIPDGDFSSSIKKGRDIGFAIVAVVVVVAIVICGLTLWILLKQSRDSRNTDNNLDGADADGGGDQYAKGGGEGTATAGTTTATEDATGTNTVASGNRSTAGVSSDESRKSANSLAAKEGIFESGGGGGATATKKKGTASLPPLAGGKRAGQMGSNSASINHSFFGRLWENSTAWFTGGGSTRAVDDAEQHVNTGGSGAGANGTNANKRRITIVDEDPIIIDTKKKVKATSDSDTTKPPHKTNKNAPNPLVAPAVAATAAAGEEAHHTTAAIGGAAGAAADVEDDDDAEYEYVEVEVSDEEGEEEAEDASETAFSPRDASDELQQQHAQYATAPALSGGITPSSSPSSPSASAASPLLPMAASQSPHVTIQPNGGGSA